MDKSVSSPVYLIDASIYIFRAYFSIPDEWHSADGHSVNAVYGYARFLLSFLQRTQPTQLVFAYDESLGSCFRNDLYPDYKSSRALPDEELAYQLAACKQLTSLMGISSVASARYEADDIIATLTDKAHRAGNHVCIVTRDKDLAQLVKHPQDHIWDYSADKRLYRQDIIDHFQVAPEQIVDYLALMGDSIDDIPGIPGVGKKTAANLLQSFDTIEDMYRQLETLVSLNIRGAKALPKKLSDYREQLCMAQQLVTLATTVPEAEQLSLHWQPSSQPAFQQKLCEYLQELGLMQGLNNQLSTAYWWKNK